MFVDPNRDVNTKVEHIWIEAGTIKLPGGETVSQNELSGGETAFHSFCRSLDPNLCFISAFVISNDDESFFYEVRDASFDCGVHCQAGREKPEVMKEQWEQYLFAKSHEVKKDPEVTGASSEQDDDPDPDVPGQNETADEPSGEPDGISIDTPKGGKVFG